jgi:undecaprenyl-diphosphatase
MAPLWYSYVSFWRRYRAGIVAALALAALSVGGLYARMHPLDLRAYLAVTAIERSPAIEALAAVGYLLGSVWFGLGLFVLLFALGHRRLAASGVGAILANALLVLFLKALTRQPRPAEALQGVRLLSIYDLDLGYPSGHAAQAFLSAYLLASYFLPAWYVQVGLYALAGLVGLSRVYTGEHLPVDVAVGGAIGILAGVLWTHSQLWPGARARERDEP